MVTAMKTLRIGFLIHLMDAGFGKELFNGISMYCKENGMQLVVFPAHTIDWPFGKYGYQDAVLLEFIKRNNLDGLIIEAGMQCSFCGKEQFEKSFINAMRPLPMATFAVDFDGIPLVQGDNGHGLEALTEHLIAVHSCKKFMLLTGPEENPDSIIREHSVRNVLKKHDIEIAPDSVVRGNFFGSSAVSILEKYLEEHKKFDFDAIICFNDIMALSTVHFLKEHGIRVPDDIIVTGFDDSFVSSFDQPTLTTVKTSLPPQGYAAAKKIHELIKNEKAGSYEEYSTVAVFRQSCGCIKEDDFSFNAYDEQMRKISWSKEFQRLRERRGLFLEGDFARIRDIVSVMLAVKSFDDFESALKASFAMLGIDKAAIILYDKKIENLRTSNFSIPEKAKLVYAFDSETGFKTTERVEFNPREKFLPFKNFDDAVTAFMLKPLFLREKQIGYIYFTSGTYTGSIFDMFCMQISNALVSLKLN